MSLSAFLIKLLVHFSEKGEGKYMFTLAGEYINMFTVILKDRNNLTPVLNLI